MKARKIDLSRRLARKKRQKLFKLALIAGIGFILFSLVFNLGVRLPLNSSKPADAILVLGGSVQREIYAARAAYRDSQIPIIISTGSKDPCIWRIFQGKMASSDRVLLEKCADSTFGNFFYSIPILRRWGVHKVKVITSPTHVPRAKWLAQIHLGAQGIAVEMVLVEEKGIPGNQESDVKTYLDVGRSLVWAIFSQVIYPFCSNTISLADVDIHAWSQQPFDCEEQLLR